MSSRVCVIGLFKDPVPLVKKSRASGLGGGFPPSFIYQKSLSPSRINDVLALFNVKLNKMWL